MILTGSLFKRYGLTDDRFLRTSDKLVYYVFFPALLFWKIGGTQSTDMISSQFCYAALGALFFIYATSTLFIVVSKMPVFKAGSFSQSCYRFNTYIGMAVVINAIGETGVMVFGVLIGILIPIINVLAVSTLIWFSGNDYTMQEKTKITLRALAANPLILACICGIVYSKWFHSFPPAVNNTLRLMTSVTLPLALISIGGALSFRSIRDNLHLSFISSLFKLFLFPAAGYWIMTLFKVSPTEFKVGMIFFSLPTATSIYILSSQLNSDTETASAAIVFSTLLSFFPLTAALLI